jgi:hypothetical protein
MIGPPGPFIATMRRIIFSLLLVFSASSFADTYDLNIEFTPIEVIRLYDKDNEIKVDGLIDFIDKEIKISKCVEEYIRKQSRTYAKIVKNNLYDLIHNFDKIVSKIYGKKPSDDDISYDEKIEALGQVQCEVYYTIGTLK